MQPRVFATLLIATCTISLMYLTSKGLVIIKNFLHEKTEETTRDITEKLLKNLSKSLSGKDEVTPEFCRPGRGSDCVPPFAYFQTKYRTAPKYNVTACVIEKSMSTVLAGVMCYLYDPNGFKNANRSIGNDVWHHRFCKDRNELSHLKEVLALRANMRLFTVVRDPIDRFLSGFTDKCILESAKGNGLKCYNCGSNVTCFVEKQYERMMNYPMNKGAGLTFEDVHFSPQTWFERSIGGNIGSRYCNFRQKFKEFRIIKYGDGGDELVRDILTFLRRAGVQREHLSVIRSDMTNSRTPHVTKSSEDRMLLEKQIRSDPYVMRLLVKMFYYDFVLFGFELPAIP